MTESTETQQAPVSPLEAGMQSAIVNISFGLPRQSRDLPDEASDVEVKKEAKHGTVRTSMFYFKKKADDGSVIDGLEKLKKFQTRFKAQTISRFAPYPYAGTFYLLPGPAIVHYKEAVALFEAERAKVWTEWADDDYPEWAKTAPERMGQLFEDSKFPSLKECQKAFKCVSTFALLATGDQWLRIAALTPDMAKTMELESNSKVQEAVAAATASLWEDVLGPIEQVVKTFSKDKFKIADSMIANIIKIVEMVPALNMEKDPALAKLAAEAKATLCTIKPDDLRKSAELCSQTKDVAAKLLAQFKPLARKINL